MLGIRRKKEQGERKLQDSAVRNELGAWRRNGTRNKEYNLRLHLCIYTLRTELKLLDSLNSVLSQFWCLFLYKLDDLLGLVLLPMVWHLLLFVMPSADCRELTDTTQDLQICAQLEPALECFTWY